MTVLDKGTGEKIRHTGHKNNEGIVSRVFSTLICLQKIRSYLFNKVKGTCVSFCIDFTKNAHDKRKQNHRKKKFAQSLRISIQLSHMSLPTNRGAYCDSVVSS